MNARTALVSLGIMAWVILVGELASFPDAYSRTAYALGIAVVAGPFVALDKLLVGRRRG